MPTQRTVTIATIPVKVTDYGFEMCLSDIYKAPKTELTFTTLDSLKAAVDTALRDKSDPCWVSFDLVPRGTRKPPGFDAFVRHNEYRNVPRRA